MHLRLLASSTAMFAALLLPAAAQDVAILADGGPFVPIPPGIFDIVQAGAVNVAGAAQTSNLPNLFVGQTGYYNRGAVVQTGSNPAAAVNQTGTFNRSLILQTTGNTSAISRQVGTYNSSFVIQTGANNAVQTSQIGAGATNGAIQNQTNTNNLGLTAADLPIIVNNFLYAPETVQATSEIGMLGGVAFVDAMIDRHAARPLCGEPTADGTPGLDCGRLAAFGGIDFAGGRQEDRLGALGFDYGTTAGTLGVEMAFSPEFLAGAALRYADTDADVDVAGSFADIGVESLGGTVFGDYRSGGVFVSAMGFYSSDEFDIRRAGLGGTSVGASPDGDTYGGAARAGYLFQLSDIVEAGPIAGYSYVRTEVDGYSESGSALLAQTGIAGQESVSQLGLIGGRLAFDNGADAYRLRGSVDVAYEHEFEDEGFTIQRTEFAFGQGIGVFTPVASIGDLDYLHLAGAVSMELPQDFTLGFDAGGRFGATRESYRIGAELKKAF